MSDRRNAGIKQHSGLVGSSATDGATAPKSPQLFHEHWEKLLVAGGEDVRAKESAAALLMAGNPAGLIGPRSARPRRRVASGLPFGSPIPLLPPAPLGISRYAPLHTPAAGNFPLLPSSDAPMLAQLTETAVPPTPVFMRRVINVGDTTNATENAYGGYVPALNEGTPQPASPPRQPASPKPSKSLQTTPQRSVSSGTGAAASVLAAATPRSTPLAMGNASNGDGTSGSAARSVARLVLPPPPARPQLPPATPRSRAPSVAAAEDMALAPAFAEAIEAAFAAAAGSEHAVAAGPGASRHRSGPESGGSPVIRLDLSQPTDSDSDSDRASFDHMLPREEELDAALLRSEAPPEERGSSAPVPGPVAWSAAAAVDAPRTPPRPRALFHASASLDDSACAAMELLATPHRPDAGAGADVSYALDLLATPFQGEAPDERTPAVEQDGACEVGTEVRPVNADVMQRQQWSAESPAVAKRAVDPALNASLARELAKLAKAGDDADAAASELVGALRYFSQSAMPLLVGPAVRAPVDVFALADASTHSPVLSGSKLLLLESGSPRPGSSDARVQAVNSAYQAARDSSSSVDVPSGPALHSPPAAAARTARASDPLPVRDSHGETHDDEAVDGEDRASDAGNDLDSLGGMVDEHVATRGSAGSLGSSFGSTLRENLAGATQGRGGPMSETVRFGQLLSDAVSSARAPSPSTQHLLLQLEEAAAHAALLAEHATAGGSGASPTQARAKASAAADVLRALRASLTAAPALPRTASLLATKRARSAAAVIAANKPSSEPLVSSASVPAAIPVSASGESTIGSLSAGAPSASEATKTVTFSSETVVRETPAAPAVDAPVVPASFAPIDSPTEPKAVVEWRIPVCDGLRSPTRAATARRCSSPSPVTPGATAEPTHRPFEHAADGHAAAHRASLSAARPAAALGPSVARSRSPQERYRSRSASPASGRAAPVSPAVATRSAPRQRSTRRVTMVSPAAQIPLPAAPAFASPAKSQARSPPLVTPAARGASRGASRSPSPPAAHAPTSVAYWASPRSGNTRLFSAARRQEVHELRYGGTHAHSPPKQQHARGRAPPASQDASVSPPAAPAVVGGSYLAASEARKLKRTSEGGGSPSSSGRKRGRSLSPRMLELSQPRTHESRGGADDAASPAGQSPRAVLHTPAPRRATASTSPVPPATAAGTYPVFSYSAFTTRTAPTVAKAPAAPSVVHRPLGTLRSVSPAQTGPNNLEARRRLQSDLSSSQRVVVLARALLTLRAAQVEQRTVAACFRAWRAATSASSLQAQAAAALREKDATIAHLTALMGQLTTQLTASKSESGLLQENLGRALAVRDGLAQELDRAREDADGALAQLAAAGAARQEAAEATAHARLDAAQARNDATAAGVLADERAAQLEGLRAVSDMLTRRVAEGEAHAATLSEQLQTAQDDLSNARAAGLSAKAESEAEVAALERTVQELDASLAFQTERHARVSGRFEDQALELAASQSAEACLQQKLDSAAAERDDAAAHVSDLSARLSAAEAQRDVLAGIVAQAQRRPPALMHVETQCEPIAPPPAPVCADMATQSDPVPRADLCDAQAQCEPEARAETSEASAQCDAPPVPHGAASQTDALPVALASDAQVQCDASVAVSSAESSTQSELPASTESGTQ